MFGFLTRLARAFNEALMENERAAAQPEKSPANRRRAGRRQV